MSEEETNYQIQVGEGDTPQVIDLTQLDDTNKEVLGKYVNERFHDYLPDDLREDPTMSQFKTLDNLGKSYTSLRKTYGKEKFTIPTDDSPEEEWKTYYEAVGVPDDPAAYELKPHSAYEEDWENIEEQYKAQEENFRKLMTELKVPKKAAEKLWEQSQQETVNNIQQMQEEQRKRLESEWTELKNEWRNEFDNKVKYAQGLANTVLNQKDMQWLQSRGLDKEPKMYEILSKFGALVSEDKIKSRPTPPAEMKGTEAKRELNRMMKDKQHPLYEALHTKNHTDHDYAVKRYNALIKQSQESSEG